VRNLVVGTGLNEQWDSAKGSCRKALENLLEDKVYRERRITLSRPPHHVIVGTDASKSYSTETGWGFATSDGRLSSGVINTTDIGRGEFYAVTCAVEKYQDTECKVLDVLTDSWEVYKTINNPASRPLDRVKQHAVHCLDAIAYARRHDLEVRVHWVRGHCGNLLNEHADRAAMNARRCRNWDLGKTHTRFMEHQIRRDLRDAISAVSVDYLMPSFTAGDAVEAVAA
jgi:ribonuclease HI